MGYRTQIAKELKAQLAFSPKDVCAAQLDRLEALIPEIVPGRTYPGEFVFFRVTLFRPSDGQEGISDGEALRQDLLRLLLEASRPLPAAPEGGGDGFLALPEVAERCSVSRRTVDRWRREGLPARYFMAPAGPRIGVSEAALARFREARPERFAAAPRRLPAAPEERRRLLERARRLAEQGVPSAASAARLLAAETGRSAASLSALIRRRARGLFPSKPCLGPEQKAEILRRSRQGEPADALADEFGISAATARRAVRHARLAEILATPVKCIENEEFAKPSAAEEIIGPEGLSVSEPAFDGPGPKPPPGLPPYLQELYQFPVLPPDAERDLFRKYNFVKWRMQRIQGQLRNAGYRQRLADEFDEHREAAENLRGILTRCNLRLVVSVAKRHAGPVMDLFDVISEGNVCLVRAVDCFDYSRGARFSTYATWALTKHYARAVPKANYRFAEQVTGQDQLLGALGDHRMDVAAFEEHIDHLRAVLARAIACLRPRERSIIESHYGLGESGGAPQTLDEIAAAAGVSRERIRQVEQRALERLRWHLGPDGAEMAVT